MGGKKKHEKKGEEDQFQQKQTKEEQPQKNPKTQEAPDQKFEPIAPKKVQYCPSNYALNQSVRSRSSFEDVEAMKKEVNLPKPAEEEEKLVTHAKEKSKGVKEKYIVIDVKNRGRKNFITTVSGLNNFNIDAKEIAKKCSKKFSLSCSATQLGTIQLQGDNFENIKQFLIDECGAKKKYILTKEEFDEKYAEEVAKKKEEKKNQKNTIKQVDQEEEPQAQPAPVVKDKNQIRLQQIEQSNQKDDSD